MAVVKKRFTIGKILIAFILVFIALTIIVPLVNLLARSLSDPAEAYLVTGTDLLPRGFSLFHYKVVFNNPLIGISFRNSLFITITGTVLSLLLTSTAAYVLTRKNLVGKKPLMYFLIFMMIMVPGMVQEYFLMKDLHLLDNLMSMVFYKAVSVYYLVIFMRFFEDVPVSIVESSMLDGAGHWTIFCRIYMPLMKVPTVTIGMFYFVTKWNEFFYSSIFLSSEKNTVLQVLLRKFVVENDQVNMYGLANINANNIIAQLDMEAMKATTIWVALIPILIIYPIVLKYHTSGVLSGGVKE